MRLMKRMQAKKVVINGRIYKKNAAKVYFSCIFDGIITICRGGVMLLNCHLYKL